MTIVSDSILVYDIETKVFGRRPDASLDKFRLFGCYSYKTHKAYITADIDEVRKIIKAHDILVGFNNMGTKIRPGYDNPILEREEISFYGKTVVDLSNIILEKAVIIKTDKGLLKDRLDHYSLKFITKTLGLVDDETGKKELDFNLLKKTVWSKEEKDLIYSYLLRDIEVTKKLYEWVEMFFQEFAHYIKKEDVDKKVYLTAKTAKFAYKAICHALNWEETYDKDYDDFQSPFKGGYVSYPAGEKFSENIYALDYNSLYPHNFLMANLYGRKKDENDNRPIWNGGGVWNVEGEYYTDEWSPVAKTLNKWYGERVQFKQQGDKREHVIKIILNTSYGIVSKKYYARVYDPIAAADCTRLGRQFIMYARQKFKEHGYLNIYTDTDSCYIQDPFKDETKLMNVKNDIISYIKSTVPFPLDTFDLKLEDKIKYMFFFKGKQVKTSNVEMDEDDLVNKDKGLMQKNYIYVNDKGKITVKNLGIMRKSNSKLSKKIFWDYLVPEIRKGTIKFSKDYISQLITKLLSEDLSLILMRKEVGQYEQYASKTSIQAQLAMKYGDGVHFLIPNSVGLGVGKSKRKYCLLEEFKQKGLGVSAIDLENVYSELSYFIKQPIIKNIFEYEKK